MRYFCVVLVLSLYGVGLWAQPSAQPRRQRLDATRKIYAEELLTRGVQPRKLYTVGELFPVGQPDTWRPARPPLLFERNVGQADAAFKFVLRSAGFAAGFHPSGITAAVVPQGSEKDLHEPKGYAIQLRLKGGKADEILGRGELAGRLNLIHGNDPSRWHSKVAAFRGLVYRSVYADVDMLAAAADGRLEYGFALGPAAKVGHIRIRVEGVSELKLDRSGDLLMVTPAGTLVQTVPTFLEPVSRGGKSRRLKGRFKILGRHEYGFEVDGRRRGAKLLIDPELVFVSYFGGEANEGTLGSDGGATLLHQRGFDLALGQDGHLFVAGTTASVDFSASAAGELFGSHDAFALRIDPTQAPGDQLVYATFVGGSGFERGVGISAGEDGSAYLIGCSGSSDFPTSADAIQPTREGSVGYVVRLDADGLVERGTFIGRTDDHHPSAIVYAKRSSEEEGFVYVAGGTEGSSAGATMDATAEAFQQQHAGGGLDGFAAKLTADLTATTYLTYLGGAGRDHVMDLAVHDGFAFVTGSTNSLDFPTTDLANQATHPLAGAGSGCDGASPGRECFEAFVTRIHRDGSTLIYSTYLGGDDEEFGRGIAVGGTQATVTGAAWPTSGDAAEIVAVRLEGGGENILWERRLGAGRTDHGEEVFVDSLGRAHLVGDISVDGLSTSERTYQGGAADIFYARLEAATGEVDYFTYLGGDGTDLGFAVTGHGTTEENFCAVAAGSTTSEYVETVNALEGGDDHGGGADLLLAALCDITGTISSAGFSKDCSPNPVEAGTSLTCTITVQNGGDGSVPATITDPVPGNLEVTGMDGTQGVNCTRIGNEVTCPAVLPSGGSLITISARAGDECARSVTNTATIQVGNQEFQASDTVQITCPPPPPPDCPNGVVDPGEECDGGPNCRPNCTLMECGDGILDPGEACDDGNSDSTDSCSNSCEIVVASGATCDGSPPCAGNLVCGQRCSFVECDAGFVILGMCFFGDSYWLCSTPSECMPESEATFVID